MKGNVILYWFILNPGVKTEAKQGIPKTKDISKD